MDRNAKDETRLTLRRYRITHGDSAYGTIVDNALVNPSQKCLLDVARGWDHNQR